MLTRSIVSPVMAQHTSEAEGTYVKVVKLADAYMVMESVVLCAAVAVPLA